MFPVYDDFYITGDWWTDYFTWDETIFTYFDDYKDISSMIHDRILMIDEGIGYSERASSNDTLEVNFQLFIKDVTNLQQ